MQSHVVAIVYSLLKKLRIRATFPHTARSEIGATRKRFLIIPEKNHLMIFRLKVFFIR